eukprot:5647853-Amphidinium_carterae.1
MNVSIPLAQKVIASAVAPQFVYGPMSHEVPKYQIHRLKMQIKRACHLYRRRNNWNALNAVVARPQTLDPVSIVRYNHMRCMLSALRNSPELRECLREWPGLPDNAVPRGPLEVWRRMLNDLHLQVNTDTWCLSHHLNAFGACSILQADWPTLLHNLRVALRNTCALDAAQQRTRLAGIPDCDLDATRHLLIRRSQIPCFPELIALVTDSAWTEYMRHRCHLGVSAECPWCHEAETLEHVLHFCPQWENLRDTTYGHVNQLLAFTPTSSQAGWCPIAASPTVKKHWSDFQLALAAIWHARQMEFHRLHDVASGPAPVVRGSILDMDPLPSHFGTVSYTHLRAHETEADL